MRAHWSSRNHLVATVRIGRGSAAQSSTAECRLWVALGLSAEFGLRLLWSVSDGAYQHQTSCLRHRTRCGL